MIAKCEALLGKTENLEVRYAFDERSENCHMTMFGISGCGKSTELERLEKQVVEQGKRVVELDFSDSSYAKTSLVAKSRIIDVKESGMISLLARRYNVYGQPEGSVDFAKRIADIFSGVFRLTSKQKGILYKAVGQAVEEHDNISFSDIFKCLQVDDASAESIRIKLQYLADIDLYRGDSKSGWHKLFEHEKAIQVLDLSGFPVEERKVIAELLLDDLRNYLTECGPGQNDFILVLDECQNLRLAQNMPTAFFMAQGRKYGCGVWLATQSSSYFKKNELVLLYQSSLILNFLPNSDEQVKISKKMAKNEKECRQILTKLQQLQRGEFIASGRFIKTDGGISDYGHIKVSNEV